jgi:hypothetical protein
MTSPYASVTVNAIFYGKKSKKERKEKKEKYTLRLQKPDIISNLQHKIYGKFDGFFTTVIFHNAQNNFSYFGI